MTLEEYVNELQTFLKDNPHLKTVNIYTADDDSGNSYTSVESSPSILYVANEDSENYNLDIMEVYSIKEEAEEELGKNNYASIVCIN